MKTVKVVYSPAKGYAIRPSDATIGKLIDGTATDWVTRGYLNYKMHESHVIAQFCGTISLNLSQNLQFLQQIELKGIDV